MKDSTGRYEVTTQTVGDGNQAVREHSIFYLRDGGKTIVHVMQHNPREVCPLCERDEFNRRLENVRPVARKASWAMSKNDLFGMLVNISLLVDGVDTKDESFIGPQA